MRSLLYVLDKNKKPISCNMDQEGFIKWAEWFSVRENRIIAQTSKTDILISTVFLGIDHNLVCESDEHKEPPKPMLFETIIFGGMKNNKTWRYYTWNEALSMHDELCIREGFVNTKEKIWEVS